jgi:isopenicillin N synthase-like dioxygenase|tara:strand:- start:3186 stop:4148 length:963 start_codon:yes stop_codon:yes gene_type:complete
MIPTLDLGPYLAGNIEARDSLAAELRDIQENIGFYVVVNHGVPESPLEQGYQALRQFFSLPLKDKLKIKINKSSVGYVPIRSTVYVTSKFNKNTKKDLNETITIARERSADDPDIRKGLRFVGPNQWPEGLSEFRSAMIGYQEALATLGYAMLPLYALALDLPANYFDPFFTRPTWWTRNTYYPAVEPDDNQFGISPHSDHGFITLLPMSNVGGLEILSQDGSWIPATPVKKGIIINTGEFLNRWSNGRFLATPHRVIPPVLDRYSMAMFFNPNPNTLAIPFASCVSSKYPAIFDPVTMIDYMCWYIDSNYKQEAGGIQS